MGIFPAPKIAANSCRKQGQWLSDDGGRGVVGQSLLPLMVGIAPALRVDDLADVVAGDAHGLSVDALCMCDPIIAVDIMGVEVALFK